MVDASRLRIGMSVLHRVTKERGQVVQARYAPLTGRVPSSVRVEWESCTRAWVLPTEIEEDRRNA